MVKNLPAMQETWVQSLDWKEPLKKEMAPHSSILAGKSRGQRSLVGYSPWGHKETRLSSWAQTTHSRCFPSFPLFWSFWWITGRWWFQLKGQNCVLSSKWGFGVFPHPQSKLGYFSGTCQALQGRSSNGDNILTKWWGEKWSEALAAPSCPNSPWPHGLEPTRLFYLWNSSGENTGVGSHFLPQGESSWPRVQTQVSCNSDRFLTIWGNREAPKLMSKIWNL